VNGAGIRQWVGAQPAFRLLARAQDAVAHRLPDRLISVGVRVKLVAHVILVTLIVLLAMGFLGSSAERQIYYREMEVRCQALLQVLENSTAIALANHDQTLLDNIIARVGEDATDLQLMDLAVLDERGRVIAHTQIKEFGKVYDDAFARQAVASDRPIVQTVTQADPPYLELSQPVVSGLRWGTLWAQFSLSEVERAVHRSRWRLFSEGLVVAAAAAIMAFFLLSLIVVRPLMRIRDMASRFGAGDLHARVHLTQRDELGELSRQLNGMAQQIEDHTDSLEMLVQTRTAELHEVNRKLQTLARTDALTGLHNRRHFMEQLELEIRRGARSKHPFALMMIDVDHFKHYNDTNGHTAGDDVLTRIATLLRLNLRSSDLIARYGGEEFVVMLFDTAATEGLATGQKLQQAVATQPMPHDDTQPSGKLTISVGLAFYPEDATEARKLVDYADQALYRSKARGRNTVTTWSELA
jgi:diguanylate cyclase (GGDEF)-like protein